MTEPLETKSLNEIWGKIHVFTTAYSTFLIVKDILEESRDLNDAKDKINNTIDELRENNCEDFKEWLKRFLHIQLK